MNSISRCEQSTFLDNFFKINKKSFMFERIDQQIKREDPFEKYASDDVWFITQGKLIRKNKGVKNGKSGMF